MGYGAPAGGAWTYVYYGSVSGWPLLLDDGRIVLAKVFTGTSELPSWSGLECVDPRALMPQVWSKSFFSLRHLYTTPPCLGGDRIFVGSDTGRIDVITTDGLGLTTFNAGVAIRTPMLVAGGLLLYGTRDGRIQALDLATGTIRWSVPETAPAATPYFLSGVAVRLGQAVWVSTAKKGAQSSVHCYDLETGRRNWVIPGYGSFISGPSTDGRLVYFGNSSGMLVGYDYQDNTKLMLQTDGPILGAAAADGEWVYAGSGAGSFFAKELRPDNPRQWQLPVTAAIGTPIVLAGGVACFGGTSANGQAAFYSLDLDSASSQSGRVLIESLRGRILLAPESRRGRVAFCDDIAVLPYGGTVYAIESNELSMLDRVAFSSTLVVDDYDVSGSTAVPLKPAFQISITISDEQLAPMARVRTALWAATPIAIVANGVPLQLGASSGEAVFVETDETGLISINAPGDIGMPSLFIRPDFFLPTYSLEVFPDEQNLNRLAQVTAQELQQARSYDGQSVVLPKYSGSSESIAASIRNTIGRRKNTGGETFTRGTTAVSSTAKRGASSGAVMSWTTEITADAVVFAPMSPTEVELWFGASRQVLAPRGGFGSFVNNVVNGAEEASKVVWHYTGDAASVVVEAGSSVYEFVVQTVKQAIDVMTSIVKTVVTSIEKFIEWLSFLFNWDDIVATQKFAAARIEEVVGTLTTWLDSQIAAGAADVHALITGWKSTANAALESVAGQLAGTTVGSTRQKAAPATILRPKGIDITIPTQWLSKKLKANLVELPQLSGGDELVALFDSYLSKVSATIASDPALQSFPQDVAAVANSFTKLFTDPGGFLTAAMDALVRLFSDLVQIGLELLETTVVALLELVREAIALLRRMLTAKISIPFVSDFYKLVAKNDLSLLNLATLVVAVPATITYKLESGSAPVSYTEDLKENELRVVEILNGFAYGLMLSFWAVIVAPDSTKRFRKAWNGFIAGGAFVLFGLGAASELLGEGVETKDWIFWATQYVQVVVFGYAFAVTGNTVLEPMWDRVSPLVYSAMGGCYAVAAAVYAGSYPDDYWDDSLVFFSYFLPAIALFGPQLYESIPDKEVAAAAVTLLQYFCYGVSAVLTIVPEFTNI